MINCGTRNHKHKFEKRTIKWKRYVQDLTQTSEESEVQRTEDYLNV